MPKIPLPLDKPLPISWRNRLLRVLDQEYQRLGEKHYECAPRVGSIPVGGGEWMDLFFRMEALRGFMTTLRSGKTVNEALADGKTVSEISVSIWNGRREWQVHRDTKTAHDYLEMLVYRKMRETEQGPVIHHNVK